MPLQSSRDLSCSQKSGTFANRPASSPIIVAATVAIPRRHLLETLLLPNPGSLATIILKDFVEPWVLERFLGRDPLLRVVDKDPLQQIQELLIELCVWSDRFL